MDILNDVLQTLRLHSQVFLHARFCNQWVVNIEPLDLQVSFHVIAHGNCWLREPDSPTARELHEGDLVICLRNPPHFVTPDSQYPADDTPRNTPAEGDIEGESTTLICGKCEFLQYYWNPILEACQNIMVIPTRDSINTNLDTIIKLMIAEADNNHTNTSAVIDRLSDILLIEAIRTYTLLDEDNRGFLAALKDPRLCKALTSFHKAPEKNWSVQTLSEKAAMSRSAFADQFKHMVGMSPMAYVTGWRMQHAHDALVSDNKSITQLSEECGYHSEPAFRKAFKKQFGIGPGYVRRQAREQAEQPAL
jgi:AraC-like DNA-binding protein